MYTINRLPVAGIAVIVKALCLTAILVLSFFVVSTVTPFVVAALATAAAFVAHIVAVAVAAIIHAAVFALACLVRAAVLVALCWLFAHMSRLSLRTVVIAGKALFFAAVVVGCFVGAIVVMPLVLAAAGKIIVTSGVMVAAIVAGKVM